MTSTAPHQPHPVDCARRIRQAGLHPATQLLSLVSAQRWLSCACSSSISLRKPCTCRELLASPSCCRPTRSCRALPSVMQSYISFQARNSTRRPWLFSVMRCLCRAEVHVHAHLAPDRSQRWTGRLCRGAVLISMACLSLLSCASAFSPRRAFACPRAHRRGRHRRHRRGRRRRRMAPRLVRDSEQMLECTCTQAPHSCIAYRAPSAGAGPLPVPEHARTHVPPSRPSHCGCTRFRSGPATPSRNNRILSVYGCVCVVRQCMDCTAVHICKAFYPYMYL